VTRFRRVRLAHVAPSFPPCDRGREASERSGLVRELSPRFAGRWPSDPRRSFLFGDLHIRLTLGKLLDKLHFCQRWQLPPFRYALRNYSRDIRHHQCFHYGRFG